MLDHSVKSIEISQDVHRVLQNVTVFPLEGSHPKIKV